MLANNNNELIIMYISHKKYILKILRVFSFDKIWPKVRCPAFIMYDDVKKKFLLFM